MHTKSFSYFSTESILEASGDVDAGASIPTARFDDVTVVARTHRHRTRVYRARRRSDERTVQVTDTNDAPEGWGRRGGRLTATRRWPPPWCWAARPRPPCLTPPRPPLPGNAHISYSSLHPIS
ncbi:unnamed protein product [Arctia plantaginis]|uniref:Uncharacterized protein n=1 Tax=Arctia plantaginis TaxID=874455 RepID=A0A8S0YY97_ARCPL|nr:unnamed protein product [Arctia plantaginis]